MVVLVAAAVLTISNTALSNISQVWASTSSQTSSQTSCVNNQPCHTVVCSEGQPCKVSETPNTDFDFEFDKDETDNLSQPLEGAGTGAVGLAPFSDPYNIYTEDQEEFLEDMQNMAEDPEYE